MKATDKERFIKMVEALLKSDSQLTSGKIAERMGVSAALFSNHLNPKRPIPEKFIEDFISEFSLNREFFDTGIGNPLTNSVLNDVTTPYIKRSDIVVNHKTNRRKEGTLIPFYNADFMAGVAESYYEDETIYPEYFMDVPEFYGCTAFRAYSDSMESKIRSGNILFGSKVEDWKSHLEFGQIYGITCTDGRRYLKYIRRNIMDDHYFLLKSENSNYDDFTIPKEKINNIWLIEGWFIKNS